MLYGAPVKLAVGLGTRPAHSRALAAIQQLEVDAGHIGGPTHQAVQCIDLADEMALSYAADRRIARHLADRPDLVGEQKRAGTDARGRSSGLAACMSPAHHDDVILLSHHDQYLVTSRCLRHT